MQIIYYVVIYLKALKHPEMVEIHLKPKKTKDAAKEYEEQAIKEYGDRIVHTKIKRVDLAKFEGGIWL